MLGLFTLAGIGRCAGYLTCLSLVEHSLGSVDACLEAILEFLVLLPLGDVSADGSANHLGHGLLVYVGDGLKLVCLVRRKSDRHGFGWLHQSIMPHRCAGV